MRMSEVTRIEEWPSLRCTATMTTLPAGTARADAVVMDAAVMNIDHRRAESALRPAATARSSGVHTTPVDHAVAVPFLPGPTQDREVGPEYQQVELD
ncbi:hypothetical protein GCM10010307_12330 [Streptomyces vastus]|uniref:Uncharacterized protein n=1 Tax=Streptomyces vastus TaxID=285451 RepID=A0ABN3QG91_9ACTN